MTLDECIERIGRYLKSKDASPRLVNVPNINDISQINERFCTEENKFIPVSSYALEDEVPVFAQLEHGLSCGTGNIFITGLSTYLKLLGEKEIETKLASFQTKTYRAHIVIICYQCGHYLAKWGTRDRRLIYDVDGDCSSIPRIVLVPPDRNLGEESSIGVKVVSGIENLAGAVERMNGGSLVVKTKRYKDAYPNTLLPFQVEINAYDAICAKDPTLRYVLLETFGSEEQWNYALKMIDKYGSWSALCDKVFAASTNLSLIVGNWNDFDSNKRWLYFIALKTNGAGGNQILDTAAKRAECSDKLLHEIYRSLLDMKPGDPDFWQRYDERKSLLNKIGDYSDIEILDYLQMLRSKEELALCYVTDNTQNEKEFIFELLNKYHNHFSRKEIEDILHHVYPALYAYLLPFRFKNEFMDRYFQDYKYQKLCNSIFPDFMKRVEGQAKDRDYNKWLEPRSAIIEQLKNSGSRLYFVDAMGVEYLGYIMSKCEEMKLRANVTVCKCELPSITEYNKEFLEYFDNSAPKVERLDQIKHRGAEGFDYTTKKLPVHLIKELEIIDEILNDIRKRLANGSFKRAYAISDHGSSRLAVINEHENNCEMQEKGRHCGRCCKVSEVDSQLDFATEERGFWVLANYDRFKGGRPASVEVHGGATLEEIVVPIIEFTYQNEKIEISIESELPIVVSYKKTAHLVLFSKTVIDRVSVCVTGSHMDHRCYEAASIGNNKFALDMPELKSAGDYQMAVFSNNNHIADLSFSVKKEGVSERNIL